MAFNTNDKFDGKLASTKEYYDTVKKLEQQNSAELAKFKKELDEKILKELYEEQKYRANQLEKEIAELKMKGIITTVAQEQKLRLAAIKKEETELRKKRLELLAQETKQYQKNQKLEKERLKQEEEILNLRRAIDENGNTKGRLRQFIDNIKADIKGGSIDRGEQFNKQLEKLNKFAEKLNNAVNNAIDSYVNYQTGINARLQSTDKTFKTMEKDLSKVAYSPLLKADKLYENLATLVQEGIVSNVEQRAFLMTIKDSVATTFDANNASLKRIIRLQQQDSTASRLGLEAFLTRYMNTLVQNTEYLTTTFDNVQNALLEASSLMGMNRANEFEYQVQKWLGAMTGLGLSESTSSSLAQALGYLGSGNIESLNSSSLQNLLVMASSRAGLSYSDMLKSGLNSNTTNALLAAVVNFVQDIWNNSKDNNVVLSQLSNTFGLAVSDVRAIANMSQEIKNSLYNTNLSTMEMYGELGYQFNQITERMNIATLMSNAISNFEYQSGATIASNPSTYALWKIADFIGSTTNGINIPHATVLGTGVDLNTTVDNLLKLGLVGYSTIANIPSILKGVTSLGNGASLLDAMGISNRTSIISRGATLSSTISGFSTSQSSYLYNQNGNAYSEAANMTMKEQQQAALQENENKQSVDLETINTNMVDGLKQIIVALTDTGIKISDNSIEGFTSAMKA